MAHRYPVFMMTMFGIVWVTFLTFNQYGDNITEMYKEVSMTSATNVDQSKISYDSIRYLINMQRRKIRDDFVGYKFSNEKYGRNISKLEDLLFENNGSPVRNLIVTTWRSGSTFFGDIVNAHPGSYYYDEPLTGHNIIRQKGSTSATLALNHLRALLHCDYIDFEQYLKYVLEDPWRFVHNARLWEHCGVNRSLCYDVDFLSSYCRLFPYQVMKIARLRLSIVAELLDDDRLEARLIFLVRDPRGVMQSRRLVKFCKGQPDCEDPARLCADMESNYQAAVALKAKYPNRFTVIRYEDLASDPFEQSRRVYEFYGMEFHPNVKWFLETHTKFDVGDQFTRIRNSKSNAFHWKDNLDFESVRVIQRACTTAMQSWGYVSAMNATHQKNFHPNTNFTF